MHYIVTNLILFYTHMVGNDLHFDGIYHYKLFDWKHLDGTVIKNNSILMEMCYLYILYV